MTPLLDRIVVGGIGAIGVRPSAAELLRAVDDCGGLAVRLVAGAEVLGGDNDDEPVSEGEVALVSNVVALSVAPEFVLNTADAEALVDVPVFTVVADTPGLGKHGRCSVI